MNHPHAPFRLRGFTLVESMVSLALSSILLALGVPGMQSLVAANGLTTELNTLITHLHAARSAALTQRQRAVLCPSDDGQSCRDSTQWSRGYMLFVDADADRVRDPNEAVVRFHRVRESVQIATTDGRRSVTYQSTGLAPGSNLTVTFCDAAGRTRPKAAIVSNTGRPRASDTAPDGSPLACG